jgi:hypothetical protein
MSISLVSIPTSSAVMYLPLNECKTQIYASIQEFCVFASPIITALPPLFYPVIAALKVIPLDKRKIIQADHSLA